MRLLAFDASGEVGWASFANARSTPVLGSYSLPSHHSTGRRFADMERNVIRLVEEYQPVVMAFEAPIFMPRDKANTRYLLCTLAGIVDKVAFENGLRCIDAPPSTVKLALTGNYRASKDEMLIAATRMGWPVSNHHEADACGVALAAYAHIYRKTPA